MGKLLSDMLNENSIKNNRQVVESTYSYVHMETVEDHTKKKRSTDETRSTKMASQGTVELTQRLYGNRQRWTRVINQCEDSKIKRSVINKAL